MLSLPYKPIITNWLHSKKMTRNKITVSNCQPPQHSEQFHELNSGLLEDREVHVNSFPDTWKSASILVS
jgi:hypothetical protein